MSRVERSRKLDLDRIVFIGRTFEEYLAMFSLAIDGLKGKRILDCPAGACSFTSRGRPLNLDITAFDIAYDHPVDVLEKKGVEDVEHTMIRMEKVKDHYI